MNWATVSAYDILVTAWDPAKLAANYRFAWRAVIVSVVSGSTAALQGEIQRDQLDLNDWVTCVSATTPKGQAEIRKISGEISAAKQQIARIGASKPPGPAAATSSIATAGASATTSPPLLAAANTATTSHSDARAVLSHGSLIDVWV